MSGLVYDVPSASDTSRGIKESLWGRGGNDE